jgi:hypothetical protein
LATIVGQNGAVADQKNAVTRAAIIDRAIFECTKKILLAYGGRTTTLFLYNFRTKTVFRDTEIASSPEDLETSLNHMFDGASVIVKRAIISELSLKFGLSGDYTTLKEAFEASRVKGSTP